MAGFRGEIGAEGVGDGERGVIGGFPKGGELDDAVAI